MQIDTFSQENNSYRQISFSPKPPPPPNYPSHLHRSSSGNNPKWHSTSTDSEWGTKNSDPMSHTIHIASVAYTSIFLGEFMQPDWDMLHFFHPTVEYHASARAISGGPVYVSDGPGKTLEYNEFYILTRYREIKEVWLDGAKGKGEKNVEYFFNSWFSLVRELQSGAIIFFSDVGPNTRWIGDEAGIVEVTCWSLFYHIDAKFSGSDVEYSRVDPFKR